MCLKYCFTISLCSCSISSYLVHWRDGACVRGCMCVCFCGCNIVNNRRRLLARNLHSLNDCHKPHQRLPVVHAFPPQRTGKPGFKTIDTGWFYVVGRWQLVRPWADVTPWKPFIDCHGTERMRSEVGWCAGHEYKACITRYPLSSCCLCFWM